MCYITFTQPSYLNIFVPIKYQEYAARHVFNRKLHHLDFLKITKEHQVH